MVLQVRRAYVEFLSGVFKVLTRLATLDGRNGPLGFGPLAIHRESIRRFHGTGFDPYGRFEPKSKNNSRSDRRSRPPPLKASRVDVSSVGRVLRREFADVLSRRVSLLSGRAVSWRRSREPPRQPKRPPPLLRKEGSFVPDLLVLPLFLVLWFALFLTTEQEEQEELREPPRQPSCHASFVRKGV